MNAAPGILHHVELYVSDLERSIAFWGWFLTELGYREHQRWKGGRSWILGPTYIVLVQVEARYREPPYHRCRVGLNHLAFHARSRAAVDALADALRTRGVELLYGSPVTHDDGQYAVYFEDPDRIKLEVVANP